MKNLTYILITTIILFTSCKKEKDHNKNDGYQNETTKSEDSHEDEDITVTTAQFESSKMQLGKLSKQDFPEVVKTTGMIDAPPQSIEIISSFYGGYIKKSNLLIGDIVRKGQAVVTIENPEFVDMQQNYLEVKEEIGYLKSEFERQKTLYSEKITSEKNYLKAASNYKRKKATLNGLRKKLKMLNINLSNVEQGNMTSTITLYSSINGSISKINVNKGTHISPADEIMEIINIDHIHIELKVFEKDAMKIKKGQEIRFKIPEVSDEYYDAEVHLVGKSIETDSRTVKVHGHLHHKTKNRFDIGMFVDAEIETVSNKSMALPETAFIEEGEHKVVLKLEKQENGTYIFEPIEVKVGKTYKGFTEILSDNIKETDTVLTKGGYSLVGAEGGGHSH